MTMLCNITACVASAVLMYVLNNGCDDAHVNPTLAKILGGISVWVSSAA